jgi:hypothetical protein
VNDERESKRWVRRLGERDGLESRVSVHGCRGNGVERCVVDLEPRQGVPATVGCLFGCLFVCLFVCIFVDGVASTNGAHQQKHQNDEESGSRNNNDGVCIAVRVKITPPPILPTGRPSQ